MKKEVLGKVEQQIMNTIWASKDPLKPAEVRRVLGEKEHAYTTIMTIMKILTEKGYLEREKKGKTYFYKALVTKKDFVKKNMSDHIKSLFDNFGELLVPTLYKEISKDEESLELLRKYVKDNED